MGHPISPDRGLNGSIMNLFDSADAGPTPIFLKQKLLPQLAERELSLCVEQILAPASRSRRKIWEFDANLHCSIIGTCLSTAELRQILVKLGLKEAATALSEYGIRHIDMPATPFRVWQAIQAARGAG